MNGEGFQCGEVCAEKLRRSGYGLGGEASCSGSLSVSRPIASVSSAVEMAPPSEYGPVLAAAGEFAFSPVG